MNRLSRILVPAGILFLFACSGVKVETVAQVPPDQIADGKHYFLRVNTGDNLMDQLLYEFSYNEVSRYLSLVEKQELADGTVDILFTTIGQNKTVSSGVGVGTANAWYSGGVGTATGLASSFSSSETKTKQLSTMLVAIKTKEARRLWYADLNLTGKGSVKTPSGSARYLAKELSAAMKDAKFKPIR